MSNRIIIFSAVISAAAFELGLISMSRAGTPPGSQGASGPLGLGYEPGELLVRFAPKLDGTQRTLAECNAILSAIEGGVIEYSYKLVPGLTLVKLAENMSVQNAVTVLGRADGILSAQPNYIYKALTTFPNDPYGPKPAPDGGKQWHLHNIGQVPPGGSADADVDAPEGSDISTGSREIEIIVAVIDMGRLPRPLCR